MPSIPNNIDFAHLPGPRRGRLPSGYDRDDAIWSPRGDYLALAYSITEARMMTYVGNVLWARVIDGEASILGNPSRVYAACWETPWCQWMSDEGFVFKSYYYDGSRLHTPNVMVHLHEGVAVLSQTDGLSVGDSATTREVAWTPYSEDVLIRLLGDPTRGPLPA